MTMGDNKSVEVFKAAIESAERFDYFVCGVAGALFAYIAKDYQPSKIGMDISSCEPMAMLCLVFSFAAGVYQIEARIETKNFNFRALQYEETATEVFKALANHPGPFVTNSDVIDREKA